MDFGRNKVYALTDDSDEVLVFNNLVDMVERLKPKMVVVDNLPNKLQNTVAELAREITFLRLKNLEKLSEERRNNGVVKSDDNDVRLLRQLYYRRPGDFQPLCTSPEELSVRALTELWAQMAFMKKASKNARTSTENPIVAEINKNLRNSVDKLSKEIHEQALGLPLYKRTLEVLGLKGPAIAYLISHDGWALKTLPREKLALRFQMTGRRKHRARNIRSRLLITLAMATVLHKHPRYYEVYRRYFERFQAEGDSENKTYWRSILRVAERILRDLHHLAKNQTPDT